MPALKIAWLPCACPTNSLAPRLAMKLSHCGPARRSCTVSSEISATSTCDAHSFEAALATLDWVNRMAVVGSCSSHMQIHPPERHA